MKIEIFKKSSLYFICLGYMTLFLFFNIQQVVGVTSDYSGNYDYGTNWLPEAPNSGVPVDIEGNASRFIRTFIGFPVTIFIILMYITGLYFSVVKKDFDKVRIVKKWMKRGFLIILGAYSSFVFFLVFIFIKFRTLNEAFKIVNDIALMFIFIGALLYITSFSMDRNNISVKYLKRWGKKSFICALAILIWAFVLKFAMYYEI